MSRLMKMTIFAVVGVIALGLAFTAGTLVTTRIASAQAGVEGLFQGGRGGMGDRGFPGGDGQDQYLADALGISLEDLQAAYSTALDQALAQAVEKGLITQAQADEIKSRSADGDGRGFGRGFGKGFGGPNSQVDMDALLAGALNITVEELQTAREQANEAALDAAVANGDITQEQADMMKAQQALRAYIDRDALTAEALGITVDELQAARDAGKNMDTLLEEQGLTQAEFQEAYQAANEAAIAKAVADGVITQEQADQISSNPSGFGGPGFGGRGGHGGPRDGDCQPPSGAPPAGEAPAVPIPTNGTNSNGA